LFGIFLSNKSIFWFLYCLVFFYQINQYSDFINSAGTLLVKLAMLAKLPMGQLAMLGKLPMGKLPMLGKLPVFRKLLMLGKLPMLGMLLAASCRLADIFRTPRPTRLTTFFRFFFFNQQNQQSNYEYGRYDQQDPKHPCCKMAVVAIVAIVAIVDNCCCRLHIVDKSSFVVIFLVIRHDGDYT
jgi:hypothetical protein